MLGMRSQDIEPRTTNFIIVLGTNGTGKSTVIREFVAAELKRGGKVLICTPHFNEWLDVPEITCNAANIRNIKSARKIVVSPVNPDEDIHVIARSFFDGLLVFDDCRAYLENLTDRTLKTLYISRRQRKLDIIAAAHSYSEMVPKFFSFFNILILFRVFDTPDERKTYFKMDYEKVWAVHKRVYEKSETNLHHKEYYKR